MTGCNDLYSNFVQGSKGMAIISKTGDCGPPSSTYKGQLPKKANMIWQSKTEPGRQRPLSERMGRPGRRHPQRQALQRGANAASKPAW